MLSTDQNDFIFRHEFQIEHWGLEVKSETQVVLYAFGRWPQYSALAGQEMKSYVKSYDSQIEAVRANPDVPWTSPHIQEGNTYDHLSEIGDI